MALSIARPKRRSLTNPSLIHFFSTSSSSSSSSSTTPPSDQFTDQDANDSHSQPPPPQQQQASFSSFFPDVKASLKQQMQNPQSQNRLNRPNLPPLREPSNVNPSISGPARKIASIEEIRKNLAEFRRRSSVPPPTESKTSGSPYSEQQQQQQQQISFQELYNRSMIRKSEDGLGSIEANNNYNPVSGKLSFQAIRESLRQMRSKASTNAGKRSEDAMSFSALKDRLKLKPMNENESMNSTVIGGTEGLPLPAFGKEDASVKQGASTEFVKMYNYGELGQKLRTLRPEVKEGEKNWFSLEELNERLRKLREMEERETESRIGGISFKDLRQCLVRLKQSDEEKAKNSIERLNLLGQWGTTPDLMKHPPKEHLVEKYFHPDNMSSAEKLKTELAKVREEFKMSESDCGSARVQVALLTTKIKHLSSVLHKKDKHSRKGLLAMVQRRKKLLKYLRRTDWDSYYIVLSKLGLRDNPDYKN
ncbi:hypothetical protein P3X46_001201 [Hevea brasiliensis]|uniref:Small ribosomal subunit protein uS15c n=1 Tax=Hevea brasiliensis TaxID=3981 RepID=A0ABQ9NE58_HEVBR|nr:uncharacterized protein LOC110646556 [Hevea brasiliensis]KAJ9189957.1 hypothetical protein P3X46_001201 [Hevea brasiliensis]